MEEDKLIYQIGLTLIPGVGDVLARKLVNMCGSAEAVFREPAGALKRLPKIGRLLAQAAANRELLLRAEKEVEFVLKYRINVLFFTDSGYPRRLRNCIDAPVLLYYKGTADLNAAHVAGIVGTRRATDYGREVTRRIIGSLKDHQALIVSGLAFGIDSCAHRFSLDAGLETIGVLGHGLDHVYPWMNRQLAERMLTRGGLASEFPSKTRPDRCNFPRRNRIIAGLCDALIVVEAGPGGGALITAGIANSDPRDVFAVPGRWTDPLSEGTNRLVGTNQAALIQDPGDIAEMMGWTDRKPDKSSIQRRIFMEMTPDEEKIVAVLGENGNVGIDDLAGYVHLPASKLSAALLNLEFEGVVKCLPGKVYALV